jgi:hypothetical protein
MRMPNNADDVESYYPIDTLISVNPIDFDHNTVLVRSSILSDEDNNDLDEMTSED